MDLRGLEDGAAQPGALCGPRASLLRRSFDTRLTLNVSVLLARTSVRGRANPISTTAPSGRETPGVEISGAKMRAKSAGLMRLLPPCRIRPSLALVAR